MDAVYLLIGVGFLLLAVAVVQKVFGPVKPQSSSASSVAGNAPSHRDA